MLSNSIKRSLAILILIKLSVAVFFSEKSLSQPSQNTENIDWILVVDTSASMVGKGGTKNIFSQVKGAVTEFVSQAKVGDSITLFTFDSDITLRSNLKLMGSIEKQSAKQIIQQLTAEGKHTYLGKALRDSLNYAEKLENRPEAASRTSSIIVFTDGIEDTVGISNPISIPSNLTLIKSFAKKPFIFLVSLSEKAHESQLDKFANNPVLEGKAEVLRSPGAINLLRAGETIRQSTRIENTPPPKIIFKPQLQQTNINFGAISPNNQTPTKILQVRSPISNQISVQLESEGSKDLTLLDPKVPVTITANSNTDIPLRLQIDKKAIAGNRTLKLTLVPETKQPNTEAQIVSIPANITIKPYLSINKNNLNFQGVVKGKSTRKDLITIETNGQFNLQTTLTPSESAGISLSENLNSIQTSPNIPVEIPIQLNIDSSIKTGSKEITIDFIETQSRQSLGSLKIQIEILDPLWLRLLPIISPIILLLLLLAWLWKILNLPADLEGELEITNYGNIDLARLKTKKLNLSKELSLKIGDDLLLGNTQVELYTIKEDGKTKIVLHCCRGSIKINEFDQFDQEIIYDGDIIDIGQVQITFRAIDHPRPDLSEDFS